MAGIILHPSTPTIGSSSTRKLSSKIDFSAVNLRINARELHEQMNSCSCLTLMLACIIYWQAKQITRTVLSGDLAQEGIDATLLLQHVSILYGQYVLDRTLVVVCQEQSGPTLIQPGC